MTSKDVFSQYVIEGDNEVIFHKKYSYSGMMSRSAFFFFFFLNLFLRELQTCSCENEHQSRNSFQCIISKPVNFSGKKIIPALVGSNLVHFPQIINLCICSPIKG